MSNPSGTFITTLETTRLNLPFKPWLCIVIHNKTGVILGQSISTSEEEAIFKAIREAFYGPGKPLGAPPNAQVETHTSSRLSFKTTSLCAALNVTIVFRRVRLMNVGRIEKIFGSITAAINRSETPGLRLDLRDYHLGANRTKKL